MAQITRWIRYGRTHSWACTEELKVEIWKTNVCCLHCILLAVPAGHNWQRSVQRTTWCCHEPTWVPTQHEVHVWGNKGSSIWNYETVSRLNLISTSDRCSFLTNQSSWGTLRCEASYSQFALWHLPAHAQMKATERRWSGEAIASRQRGPTLGLGSGEVLTKWWREWWSVDLSRESTFESAIDLRTTPISPILYWKSLSWVSPSLEINSSTINVFQWNSGGAMRLCWNASNIMEIMSQKNIECPVFVMQWSRKFHDHLEKKVFLKQHGRSLTYSK